jgi:putative spermidine/putrescine transport system permease protein
MILGGVKGRMPTAVEKKHYPHAGLLLPGVIWLVVVMCLPTLYLLVLSFREFRPGEGIMNVLSFENYRRILTDWFYIGIFLSTLKIGLMVTVVSAVVAYPVAIYVSRLSPLAKSIVSTIVLAPLLVSAVIRTFGWMILLSGSTQNRFFSLLGLQIAPFKILYTEIGVVIGLASVLLPFMIISLEAAISNIRASIYDAARSLGASSLRIFATITLPLSAPGLRSGAVLVFTLAASSFVTPSLMGGPTVKVTSVEIYRQSMVLANWPAGAAFAFVMLVMIVASIALFFLTLGRFGRQ